MTEYSIGSRNYTTLRPVSLVRDDIKRAINLIDERLSDLREANENYKTHSRDRSSDIQRNEREIYFLRNLRSELAVPSS